MDSDALLIWLEGLMTVVDVSTIVVAEEVSEIAVEAPDTKLDWESAF